MSSSHETIVFDDSGEILLLLETNDVNCDQWGLLHPDSSDLAISDDAPADEPAADEAFAVVVPVQEPLADEALEHQADFKTSDAVDDGAFLDSEVGQSRATFTRHIAMQVSHKHLTSASKVFKHMSQDTGWDFLATNDHEPIPIPLAGDDIRSMYILLNIVHGRTRRVPRRVGKRDLLRVVKLIDKYEFHEVAEICTDMWFEALRPSIPCTFHPGLATWIYICWYLKKPKELGALVKIAIWESSTSLDDPDRLVPD